MRDDGVSPSSAIMARASLADEIAAVRSICRDLGLGEVRVSLLKAAHHTTLRITPPGIVARIQSAEPPDVARERSLRELAVAQHIADRGGPALLPLGREQAGPFVVAPCVVTFWPYAPHERTADDAEAGLAAATLASLHDGLADYGGELPPYTQALDRCWNLLSDDAGHLACPADDRAMLRRQYRRLRREVEAATTRWVPLHGDIHLGNLLIGGYEPLWVDFEDACLGPREYDMAGLPSAAWPFFEDADQELIARFADLKSVCVAVWCLAEMGRSAEIREAAEYHLQRARALAS